MPSFEVIKQRNKILSQIEEAKRNNPFGGAAPPVPAYLVHYNSNRDPVPCRTVSEVWTAIGKRYVFEGYSVESPAGLSVREFIPF
jgi:hypothetical protein